MKGIILAAGRGSRMGALTDDSPKGMVNFAGRPLIAWQIEKMRQAGITEIALCSGYQAEMLEQFNCPTFHNPDWQQTNMLHTLRQAGSWLESTDCVVSYSDILYSAQPVTALIESKADIALTYDPDWKNLWCARSETPLSDAETFRKNGNILTDIGSRPQSLEEVEGQYMGLLRFSPIGWGNVSRLIDEIGEETARKADMTSTIAKLIHRGQQISVYPNSGPWGEIDTASDLALYQSYLGKLEWQAEFGLPPNK